MAPTTTALSHLKLKCHEVPPLRENERKKKTDDTMKYSARVHLESTICVHSVPLVKQKTEGWRWGKRKRKRKKGAEMSSRFLKCLKTPAPLTCLLFFPILRLSLDAHCFHTSERQLGESPVVSFKGTFNTHSICSASFLCTDCVTLFLTVFARVYCKRLGLHPCVLVSIEGLEFSRQ